MMKSCFLAVMLGVLPSCTSVSEIPARTAASLEAVKSIYVALCQPPVVGKEKACDEAKTVINTAIDGYTAVNEELPE